MLATAGVVGVIMLAAASVVIAAVATAGMAVVVAIATVGTFAAIVVRAATAATATVSRLKFFGSGVAHFYYFTVVSYCFTGERMVEIHTDTLIVDFEHFTDYAEAFGGHHR